MEKREVNISRRIAVLACRNLSNQLSKMNGFLNFNHIRVHVVDEGKLYEAIWAICRGEPAEMHRQEIDSTVAIHSRKPLTHTVDKASTLMRSIEASVEARSCQKKLVTLFAAEEYLRVAYDYDCSNGGTKAQQAAFNILTEMFSPRFMKNFILKGRPQVDPVVKSRLYDKAFDRRYAFSNEMDIRTMAHDRYLSKYFSRDDFFLKPKRRGLFQYKTEAVTLLPRPMEDEIDIKLFRKLNVMEYADMPLHHKQRKVVNLNARCRDIFECPVRVLPSKAKYLQIELKTKHSYIMSYYNNGLRVGMNRKETAEYYLRKEAEMYQSIWHTDESVYCDGETITLHTGIDIPIPEGQAPYEVLHRVNAVYAALFGFTPDDVETGMKWSDKSVRKAYTDEGMANYRFAVTGARMSGILR